MSNARGVTPNAAAIDSGCRVLELRQYTLHPMQRDTLVELFDRELLESQETLGIRVVGQFRDADNADRFVWIEVPKSVEKALISAASGTTGYRARGRSRAASHGAMKQTVGTS